MFSNHSHILAGEVFNRLLQLDGELGHGAKIELGSALNDDPNSTPWVGIRVGKCSAEPYLIGTSGWKAKSEVLVYAQAASLQDDSDAHAKLEILQTKLVKGLLWPNQYQSHGAQIIKIEVAPFKQTPEQEALFITTELCLTFTFIIQTHST